MKKVSQTFDEEAVTAVYLPGASRWTSISTQLLLVLNIILMVCLLDFGWTAYQDLHAKSQRVEAILHNPQLAGMYAGTLLREAASTFLLGDLNGTIANFANNMLHTGPIVAMAGSLFSFSESVMTGFNGAPSIACHQMVTCPQGGNYLECANGNVVWCAYQGEKINCANQTCITNYVYSVATFVNSVSGLLMELGGNQHGGSASNAAFDDGLINLQALLPWLQAQGNVGQWQRAGTRCMQTAAAVKSVSWKGEYIDFNGNQRYFDVTKNVLNAVNYVEQICSDLAQLNASSIEGM